MRPLQYLLASNLLVLKNDEAEHSRLEEIESTDFPHKERWQSGRMRVFAKDVTGQKLVHGFESRPLRFFHTTPICLWEQLQNFRGDRARLSPINLPDFSHPNFLSPLLRLSKQQVILKPKASVSVTQGIFFCHADHVH